MEYCGAGSVLDIMKLRGIYHAMPKGIVKSLTEEEIATVLCDTLKGKTKKFDNNIRLKHRCTVVGNSGGGGALGFWPNFFEGGTLGRQKIYFFVFCCMFM